LGVDGYRLDTVNFYFHDAALRDNPGRGRPVTEDPAVNSVNPYGWQQHKYDKSQPENLVFLQRLRALLDQYPNTTMVGEIGDDDGLARVAEYTQGGDKLHMAYCFDLLGEAHSAPYLHGVLQRFQALSKGGWPCWALSNHDVVRVATRWGGAEPSAAKLRLAAALQLSLRGSVCIYQGDELGLPEAVIELAQLQDPYGITMWPEFKGRDGCRTPMPWNGDSPHAGFSPQLREGTQPWLPVSSSHVNKSVQQQNSSADSLLGFYTHLLHWRKRQPALVNGDMTLLAGHPQVLAYVRSSGEQRLLCVLNFSSEPAVWGVDAACEVISVAQDSGLTGAQFHAREIRLQPWSGLFATLA
jgi:alpha-glucosidase